MTGWGVLLLVAFLVLGLRRDHEPRPWYRAAFLTAVVITAVTLGAL
jgi:hypothetical protein